MSEQSDNDVQRRRQGDLAVLDCPACHEVGVVRRALGQAPGGGDAPIWRCRACNGEWDDQGWPRSGLYFDADMAFGPIPEEGKP